MTSRAARAATLLVLNPARAATLLVLNPARAATLLVLNPARAATLLVLNPARAATLLVLNPARAAIPPWHDTCRAAPGHQERSGRGRRGPRCPRALQAGRNHTFIASRCSSEERQMEATIANACDDASWTTPYSIPPLSPLFPPAPHSLARTARGGTCPAEQCAGSGGARPAGRCSGGAPSPSFGQGGCGGQGERRRGRSSPHPTSAPLTPISPLSPDPLRPLTN